MSLPRSLGKSRKFTLIKDVEEESLIKTYCLTNIRQKITNASPSPREVPVNVLVTDRPQGAV
jgi:hypothetical protein